MSKPYYVAPEFRTNPLSHQPAPDEVQIDDKIYDNIHYKEAYLATINSRNNKFIEDSIDDSYLSLADVYGADKDYLEECGVSLETFLDSQMPDPKD